MKKIVLAFSFFFLSTLLFAVRLEGKIKSYGVQLGNISLQFVNAENSSYLIRSNFLGEYQIELPAGYYRISVEDENYSLAKSYQKTHYFGKNESFSIELEEKAKKLEGVVLDEKGYPIEAAEIVIKTSKGSQQIQSDRYGKFSLDATSDLVTIVASKEGFLQGGEVIFVKARNPMKNIQIILKKQYSYIRGIVTDGVKALPGVAVRLRNENLEILDEVFSDSLGYYEFSHVENNRNVAIGVYEEEFEEYLSPFLFMNKNYEKQHIILRKS